MDLGMTNWIYQKYGKSQEVLFGQQLDTLLHLTL